VEMAKYPHCSGSVLFEFHDYQGSVRVRVPVKFVKKRFGFSLFGFYDYQGSVRLRFYDYQGSVRVRNPVKFVKKGSGSLCSDSMITRLRFGPGSVTTRVRLGFGFLSSL